MGRPVAWVVAVSLWLSGCGDREFGPPPILPEDADPAWSPDGQWLAFQHTGSDSTPGLYIARIDGTERRLLVPGPMVPGDWSPDGTAIAFTVGFAYQISRINLATDSIVSLTTEGFNTDPAWSPDGESIAFLSDGIPGGGEPGLWLMRPNGTGLRRLPFDNDSAGSSGAGPSAWSPTGDRLAMAGIYFTSPGRLVHRLFVGDTLGRDTAWLTAPTVNVFDAAWSPTGEWIAYTKAAPQRGTDIWLIRPDGSEDHLLAPEGQSPTWSPDGQRVAFSRSSPDEVAVWSVDLNGGDLQQLSWPRGRPPAPMISPRPSRSTTGGAP